MNYKKHYDNLIKNYGNKEKPAGQYMERHHIVPRCLGGTDDESNLVYLDVRAHVIAHQLLMHQHGQKNSKLNIAFATMITRKGVRLTSRLYKTAREAVSGEKSDRAKATVTPLGRFGSAREAARVHKVSISTITKKAKSRAYNHRKYYYEDSQVIGNERTKHGLHLATAVKTPLGVFLSCREAARAHNTCHSVISKRAKNPKRLDYTFV